MGASMGLATDVAAAMPIRLGSLAPRVSTCSGAMSNSSFQISNMAYMSYQIEPNTFEEWPNGTHMSFEVANQANGAQVFCTFSELDGEVQDPSHPLWHACDDVGAVPTAEQDSTTETYAWFDKNTTVLSLNQTWSCGRHGDVPSTKFTVLASGEVHAECEDHSGETARTKIQL
ncbi:uncharacterized protein E0L32_006215 [Thyridium curvatum]|uniref:AA1-like domain-containing protein n=1 Tax=Thyridium curvatum TaxID=1093900 RepID=A0A507ARQ0_9PEZI|nr:uncharacterized protein E0L32_006215 [Thyridium curvatum]TPX13485.1 hypothetical protein E0L32_006215 [Thyridium curvatum]